MLRTLPIAADRLDAIATGQVEPVMIWADVDGRRQLTDRQEIDETTGELLWTIHALVRTGDRPELLAVRVPAPQCPVVTALGPIDLHGLEVNVRVGKDGKLAAYWSAVGVADPALAPRGNGHKVPEHKAAEPVG